ncbi:MAG: ATP synthase F1 subunit delta [Phycisphaerales bacterium]|nr:ATP synthase F1 subunit delta [Phycisphaerales bacterium]
MAAITQQHSPLASAYAQSLLDLAVARQAEQSIGAELAAIAQMLREQPQAQALLENPSIGIEERRTVIEKAFKGQITPLLYNFMQVANQHAMAGKLREIAAAYQYLLDCRQGRIEVDMTVPQPMEPADLERVRQRIGQALNKTVVLHQRVEQELIGGMVLQIDDRIIDASVRTQLQVMKQQLLQAAGKR